jgi:hypothetical protein
VENLLTLLNAKYIGTPYLSFSLSPRPLQLLSLDPADPNLWFSQLLARRSSGIEGVQEFTAVLVVPRDQDFCLNTRLRRVCLLDAPPGPLTYDERYTSTLPQLVRMLDYVERTYPIGTPIEELDVEVIPEPAPPEKFPRAIVRAWAVAGMGGFLNVIPWITSPSPSSITGVNNADAVYKHPLELWLDTVRDEYERDVARSPLERGVLLGEDRTLDTCFTFAQNGLALSNSAASVTPLALLNINPGEIDIGGVRGVAVDPTLGVRERAMEAVTRWNALEHQLATILRNRRTPPKKPGKVADPRVLGVLLERWAKLQGDDPRNLDFNAAVAALGLSAEHRRILKAAGAGDLRSIARALRAAPKAERYNTELAQLQKLERKEKFPGQALSSSLSAAQGDEMRHAIVDAMAKSLGTPAEG